MCKCLPKQTVLSLGLVLTIFFGALSIICIVISGVDYQQTDMKWTDVGPWRHLAALQVSAVVVVFFIFLLGLITFTCGAQCKTIQLIFVMFEFLTMILTLAVAIFALVAGAIGQDEYTKMCNKNYTGIFEDFKVLDKLMFEADKMLCSDKCMCNLNTNESALEDFNDFYNEKIRKNGDGLSPAFDNFIVATALNLKYNTTSNITRLQDCGDENINSVKAAFGALQISKINIKMDDFMTFWGRIEKKFDCNGWCESSYTDGNTYHIMSKYLFSDVNKGVVRNRGCMHRLIDWLPKVINTFGSVLLIIGIILIFVFAFGVSLLCDCTIEGSNFPNEERGQVHRKKLTETDKGPQSIELKEVDNKEEKPLNA